MSATTIMPASALLEADRLAALERLLDGLDPAGIGFVAGYATARARAASSSTALPGPPPAEAASRVSVVYGSQTGNARRLAERFAQQLAAAGTPARLVNLADYATRDLAQEKLLYVFISTQGDGDPPDTARGFLDFLASRKAPKLPKLSYGIYALGDSSYPKFCEIGRVLDARLAELGATSLSPRLDADGEPEEETTAWLDQATAKVRAALASEGGPHTPTPSLRLVSSAPAAASRHAPAEAEVLANHPITARNAEREVRHIELGFKPGALAYEPGDAIGIQPHNPPETVARLIQLLGAAADTDVRVGNRSLPLAAWLRSEREITRLARPFIEAHARLSGASELSELLQPGRGAQLRRMMERSQVVDLLAAHPAAWDPSELVSLLKPLTPRLYSIASSPAAVGDEVHLAVALVDGTGDGYRRLGAASGFLSREADSGFALPAYVEPNDRFRLPRDGGVDIVMIGAGTGVAPFRAFVQHRRELGQRGRNWLFFGARHLDTDFLYQTEWQEALKNGSLSRIDVAFSRDQADKVYVQHRLRQQGAQLWAWLESGAALYVCGDATHMAPDVHAALREVAVTHGALSVEDAEAYLARLASERRYLRDVY